jgi:hypothetical protein
MTDGLPLLAVMMWSGRAAVGEQPVDRLPGAKAGRGQGRAKVLLASWPAGHVLGFCLNVMPDIGDVADVHGQQRELARDRPPAEASSGGRGVTPLDRTGGFPPAAWLCVSAMMSSVGCTTGWRRTLTPPYGGSG